ncbi:glycoside hydrolase family protein [Amycolatopsis magusensis]|uniref:glycoside hydrolase family protein n=1 Tax=Amycolatopsis magusensis TaxID=882444 RepID=UPI0024A990E3|nr:glycoside hydrolase family protein [Amycolatopsis magusensis]MDI5978635.1 glycoside hydrolase family protein [Amycolatopsis magusensis]
MKSFRRLSAAVLVLLVTLMVGHPVGAIAAAKKGVSVNTVPGVDQALRDVRAGWFYNWAADLQGVTKPDGTDFVPMIWGAGAVTPENLAKAKSLGTTLLGFNEPDMAGQANLTVEQALDRWPQLQATGMRLGAPAVAFGGDQAGGWLDRFMSGAAARGLRVDFIPLHWYGSDFSAAAVDHLRGYLQNVHNRYGKPIWLTEYALIDFTQSTPRYPSQDQQVAFVKNSSAMLQSLSFVERYSWFTLSTTTAPTGLYDGATANASGQAYRSAG